MLSIYNTASICVQKEPFRCGLRLQPDITNIMANSRNWDELQYTWIEWRRNTGQNMKETYEQLVHLSNEAARLNSNHLCVILKNYTNQENFRFHGHCRILEFPI